MRHLGRIAVVASFVGITSSGALARAETGELSVEEAVSLALGRNERARISELNVVVAEAAVLKARTAFFPTVGVTGNYTQKPTDVVAANKNTYSLLSAITVNQPLLNAAAFPLYAQSKRLLDGQQAQTVDDKRLLAYDAVRAFFAVLSADAIASAADDRLKTAKLNVKDTQDRVDGGFVSSNDVSRATVDLGNAIHELESDRGISQVAYVTLAFTINAPVPTKLTTPTTLLAAGRAAIPPIDSLLRTAIARRPDLASKRHLATAAHDFAEEPLLRLVPTIGLAGTFQLSSDPTLAVPSPTNGKFFNNEFLTLTVSWPLFDAGVRYADKRSRDGLASVADLTVDALVRSVDEQVRGAEATLRAAQAALVGAAQARDAAQKSLGETNTLYKQGLGKAIELVDANASRFLAEVNYATAEYSVALAYLALRQAIGLDPIGTELR
jgi:outer membrane protein TolC